jgi:hypothetical protein
VLAQIFGGEAGQALIVFDQEGADQRIAVVHLAYINPSRPLLPASQHFDTFREDAGNNSGLI